MISLSQSQLGLTVSAVRSWSKRLSIRGELAKNTKISLPEGQAQLSASQLQGSIPDDFGSLATRWSEDLIGEEDL